MGAHPPPKAEVRGSNPLECANLFVAVSGLTMTHDLCVACHLFLILFHFLLKYL